jgi:hypothetical protein
VRAEELLTDAGERACELGMVVTLPEKPAGRTVFFREGDYWSIAYERDLIRLKDSKGLGYLARLLATPGREIHALDLAAGEGASERERAALGDAGELLDAEAKRAYKARLEDLEDEHAEAEAFADPERAAQAAEERDFLVRELAQAVGLHGRDRKAASAAERARVSVTRAIRSSLARIGEESPELGKHFERTVRTGTFCVYDPDPRAPIDWRL